MNAWRGSETVWYWKNTSLKIREARLQVEIAASTPTLQKVGRLGQFFSCLLKGMQERLPVPEAVDAGYHQSWIQPNNFPSLFPQRKLGTTILLFLADPLSYRASLWRCYSFQAAFKTPTCKFIQDLRILQPGLSSSWIINSQRICHSGVPSPVLTWPGPCHLFPSISIDVTDLGAANNPSNQWQEQRLQLSIA